ncbi:MAG: hypothetical protein P4M11_13180 [Candidatus Pacebacteria bacterium]|nr:hypothetical protein [Candidatus Paceibacterota bacterium]
MINTNQEYTAVNSSTTLANCRNTKRRTTVCEYIVEMTTYAYTVGFFGLRVEQDSVSRRLESELTSMSRQGETVQYMITGICVGLITASACIILPIFIWVIKDKSYVLAIFSDITQKEASRIITDSRKLDIKNLHYKKRWIETAGDSHESFWKKLIAEHRKGFGRKVDDRELDKEVVVRENSGDLNFKNESKSPAEEKKAEEESKEESDDEEAEEIRNQKEKEKLKKEAEEAAKKVKRRKKLSEIDYALRRKFILRLLLVVFIFYGYAGFAFYFNNYVHENNAQASTYLFAFCKRSIYLHNLNFVLLEALGGYNKTLAGRNNGTNGQLFMQDIADEMMRIEAQAKEFQKTASRSLYGGYLDQLDIFEGPGFCNESDKYTDIGKFLGNCTQLYKGPMNNGLAAGVAYFLDLHINVAQALIALNTSSSTAVSQFATTNSSLGNISPSLTYPLSFAIGALLTTFYTCAVSFFLLVKKVIYGTSIGFVCVFVTVYVTVFSRFISILSEEIWHTRGMLNMIPAEIIEKNLSVREQVWKRKGMK